MEENFVRQSIDKITDQDLLQIFQRSLSERKDSEAFQITSASVERYAASAFYGLPDDIIANRVQRLKALLEDQFKQEEVQKEVAEFVSDLLYKFGDSDYFSNLLERILDNSNLAQKIQSFAITKQRVSELMTQDEIAVMDGGKCILQVRGVRPFFSDKFDITKHPQYRHLSDADPKNAFDMEKHLRRRPAIVKPDEVFDYYEIDADELQEDTGHE